MYLCSVVGRLAKEEKAQVEYVGNFQSFNPADCRFNWENTIFMSVRVMSNSLMQPILYFIPNKMIKPLIMTLC